MSLYDYFLHHDEFVASHNCAAIDVDYFPPERRQGHSIAAISTLLLSAIYMFLYLPCMQSLWKHQKDGNTCYRFLFYSGVCDLYMILSLGFLHGYLALKGAVYCTDPTLLYFTSAVHDGFFSSETLANMVLAINRCLDILLPEMARTLFEGRRIWLWLFGVSLYGGYWLFFVPPAIFNGVYFAYFFNPFIGYKNELNDVFHPLTHTLHDWIIGGGLPLVYIIFLIGLKLKMRGAVGGLGLSRLQLMSFLQVLVLSILHVFAGFFYVIMQIMPVSETFIVLAQFGWFHIHAFPPIIFLVINRTVRNDCILLFHRIFHPNRVSRMHGVTVLNPKSGLPPTSGTQNSQQNTATGANSAVGPLPPLRGQQEKEQF